jgi:hypothetical protein
MALWPYAGHYLLILKVSGYTQRRTTLDRTPLDESPVLRNTQHSQQTNIQASGGIQTHNRSAIILHTKKV